MCKVLKNRDPIHMMHMKHGNAFVYLKVSFRACTLKNLDLIMQKDIRVVRIITRHKSFQIFDDLKDERKK